jgi:Integrase core domain
MNIQPEPAHTTPFVDNERERGGTHDKDGFVLTAHPGKSQGRPRTTSSSQLISQNGLPDRVSQQQPQHPGARCSRRGRTAVSCPDNGNEFQAGFHQLVTDTLEARHTYIRSGRPQTNGHVERLHRTILEECWRPSFARYVYIRYTGLRRDLDHYLRGYNHDRIHHGRLTQGRIPADIVHGARKMKPR